jgi:hypothetical protein
MSKHPFYFILSKRKIKINKKENDTKTGEVSIHLFMQCNVIIKLTFSSINFMQK